MSDSIIHRDAVSIGISIGAIILAGASIAYIAYIKWNKHHHSFDYYWRNDSFNPVVPIRS